MLCVKYLDTKLVAKCQTDCTIATGRMKERRRRCGVAKGHTVVQRQKGGAWRTTRVLAARSSFVSHSALGSESSGMKRAGTERGSTVSQSRQLVRVDEPTVLFRDVPRRGLQTLAHPFSLSPWAFVFEQGDTRSFVGKLERGMALVLQVAEQ